MVAGIFQSPVHRVSHCYPYSDFAFFSKSLTFSPLFIGSLTVTSIYEVITDVDRALSVPCSSGLSLLQHVVSHGLLDFRPFSPLFIGSLTVTPGGAEADGGLSGLSVPCSSGLSLLRETTGWENNGLKKLSVPCSSGLSLLRRRTESSWNPEGNFQSPVHRVSHCYDRPARYLIRWLRPFSPLFIGSLTVTLP